MPVVTHPHTLLSYTRNGVPSLILPLEHPSELWHLIRARYYEPSTGRFITQDPFKGNPNDPASLNLYVYCKNNPLKYTDPSGYKEYGVGKYWDVYWDQNYGKVPEVLPSEYPRKAVAEQAKAYLDGVNNDKQIEYHKNEGYGPLKHYQCNTWAPFVMKADFLDKMINHLRNTTNQDLAAIIPFGGFNAGHVYVYLAILFKDQTIEPVWLLTETNAPRRCDCNPFNNDKETGYGTVPVISPKVSLEPKFDENFLQGLKRK